MCPTSNAPAGYDFRPSMSALTFSPTFTFRVTTTTDSAAPPLNPLSEVESPPRLLRNANIKSALRIPNTAASISTPRFRLDPLLTAAICRAIF